MFGDRDLMVCPFNCRNIKYDTKELQFDQKLRYSRNDILMNAQFPMSLPLLAPTFMMRGWS